MDFDMKMDYDMMVNNGWFIGTVMIHHNHNDLQVNN